MLTIYNSLSKKEEEFQPIQSNKKVGIYTCGPTVYDYVTVGNWRTYTLGDIVNRVLIWNGFEPTYIMNITDVGHLTGDNEGDADTGVDRMEKAKKREGKTAWDVARFYGDDFQAGYVKLNLTKPEKFTKATEYIAEQIDLVEKLEQNGLTYKINDGIYFDTAAYEKSGFTYGELSNLKDIKAGARVAFNREKRNARDFALWKFSLKEEKRDMEWDSPWGVGFPGWHIECSAMSMKYLGQQFDLHIGGEDLKSTHHPNEIAQAQGATGKAPFVKYWLHGAFLQVDGRKMSKSLGNAYNLHNIENKGYSPLVLRYFYLTGHYRSPLNFTWESLDAAASALQKLYRHYIELGEDIGEIDKGYIDRFENAINNDLNMPQALAVIWELLKDTDIPSKMKKATLLVIDKVLGLELEKQKNEHLPKEVVNLVSARDQARKEKNWSESDRLRKSLTELGYDVSDTETGTKIFRR